MRAIWLAQILVVEVLEEYSSRIVTLLNSPEIKENQILKKDLLADIEVIHTLIANLHRRDEWNWNVVFSNKEIISSALSFHVKELENGMKNVSELINGLSFIESKKRIEFAKDLRERIVKEEPLNDLYGREV